MDSASGGGWCSHQGARARVTLDDTVVWDCGMGVYTSPLGVVTAHRVRVSGCGIGSDPGRGMNLERRAGAERSVLQWVHGVQGAPAGM